jgi:hypothetical protein
MTRPGRGNGAAVVPLGAAAAAPVVAFVIAVVRGVRLGTSVPWEGGDGWARKPVATTDRRRIGRSVFTNDYLAAGVFFGFFASAAGLASGFASRLAAAGAAFVLAGAGDGATTGFAGGFF